ncbi:hypothetical protein J2744_000863 [Halorubrum trapanicum]|uniref:Uncharacterized protein n=1 Tax=Halorubrum trapanicum TaxID=29284 RepID=A0A8J7UP88_9EURY|nr:hypothetical protein [Halorubrum trapanicum]MBP1901193.1 hypothetical protein [Halorubrum trapanicum]
MTDPTAEAAPEQGGDRAEAAARVGAGEVAGEEIRAGADGESTAPVASMDVAPELFPADAADDETERGAE